MQWKIYRCRQQESFLTWGGAIRWSLYCFKNGYAASEIGSIEERNCVLGTSNENE